MRIRFYFITGLFVVWQTSCSIPNWDAKTDSFLPQSARDTLNRFDANGKPTGYWVLLRDSVLTPNAKAKDAKFYSLTYCSNGSSAQLPSMFKWSIRPKEPYIFQANGSKPVNGQIVLLDGDYSFYSRDSVRLGYVKFNRGLETGEAAFTHSGGIYDSVRFNINKHACVWLQSSYTPGRFDNKYIDTLENGKWKFYKDKSYSILTPGEKKENKTMIWLLTIVVSGTLIFSGIMVHITNHK